MNSRVDEILSKHFPVVVGIEKDADGQQHFAAWLLDLPGCAAQAETREEARELLNAIKPAYFAELLKLGVAIPEPTQIPAVIPGLAWFSDDTSPIKESFPGQLPKPEVRGAGWLEVVAA